MKMCRSRVVIFFAGALVVSKRLHVRIYYDGPERARGGDFDSRNRGSARRDRPASRDDF